MLANLKDLDDMGVLQSTQGLGLLAKTGQFRHTSLGTGKMDTDALRTMIRAGAKVKAPIVVETPGPRDVLQADLDFVRDALKG